ncbi:translation elongation factor Ts [Candidatus Fermentibacterales bacterium]|nr:translation elongation factor Ts [Candidatus Fermentibacterales bacterium]
MGTEVSAKAVMELRELSGAGVMDCKKALAEAGGDMDAALRLLREQGIKVAGKKAVREASEGLVLSYIHGEGRLGVLVEVNCETDFVARTDDFRDFCKKVAMQIAAKEPLAVRREDIPVEVVEEEKNIYRAQLRDSGKPANIVDRIVDGKLEKFYEESCLLDQAWIHDESSGSVKDVQTGVIARLGENVVIRRFSRFELGR